jgi:hypothetical protein
MLRTIFQIILKTAVALKSNYWAEFKFSWLKLLPTSSSV